jgi:hypothetical protein
MKKNFNRKTFACLGDGCSHVDTARVIIYVTAVGSWQLLPREKNASLGKDEFAEALLS